MLFLVITIIYISNSLKMHLSVKHKTLTFLLLFIVVANAYTQRKLELRFLNMAGDSVLKLGNSYANQFNETFTVRNFKYYVSHIQLKDKSGKLHSISDSYYLINEADTESLKITLQYNIEDITSIRFLLGVDSIKNVSGVQTGALDPAKGMFWTWNTGYIMAKLEGKSSASKAPGNYFTYHIGGFKPKENVAKWIELPVQLPGKYYNTVYIKADALKWFKSVHDIMIAEKPVCHEPGKLAMLIADNYATMFSIADKKD